MNINVNSNGSTTVSLNGPVPGTVQALGFTNTYNLSINGGTAPYTISAVGPLPIGPLSLTSCTAQMFTNLR